MTITAARYEGRVSVRDDRTIGVAVWGPPDAERAVVWFHGTPGARRQIPEQARRYAIDNDVMLIGIDRPGVGFSSPHLYRKLLDFNDDLLLALDEIGVGRFSVVGLSGGAPYALAAAYGFGQRVPTVGVLGGVVPSGGEDGVGGGLVGVANRFKPFLPLMSEPAGAVLTGFVHAARFVGPQLLGLYGLTTPPGDRAFLAVPENREMFLDDILNSGRHGMRASIYDAILFTRYWGFSVRDITQRVVWWQGDKDNIVPMSHAEHVVPLLARGELRLQAGGGHLSGLGFGAEVLETVLEEF